MPQQPGRWKCILSFREGAEAIYRKTCLRGGRNDMNDDMKVKGTCKGLHDGCSVVRSEEEGAGLYLCFCGKVFIFRCPLYNVYFVCSAYVIGLGGVFVYC